MVHHAICNIIEPVFDERFIHDSFANRVMKGTLNAIKRFDIFKRKASQNNTIRCYVLKADIKSYFETLNHRILLEILGKRIKEERFMWLIRKIISNHKGKEKISMFLSSYPVLPLDEKSAKEAGETEAELLKSRFTVVIEDIMITAIAKVHGEKVVTRDADFTRIPGLRVLKY